jgi:peptidoglycan/LPS O-acetylase OafA/YrhL
MDNATDTTFQLERSKPADVPIPIPDRLKVNNFDGMRLLFASMVVVFHIALLSQAASLALLHKWVSSLFAVQAFFFVSGFLVVMSFDKTKSIGSYFKKRSLRIAPAYIAVVLGGAVLLASMSTLSLGDYFTSPGWRAYLVSNLLLSNFANPSLPGVFTDNYEQAVNGSLWTIKIEVMYYCSVPFLVWGVHRFGYKPLLAAIFIGAIAWHAGLLYLADASGNDFYARLAKQLPGQMSFFAGGAFAYYRTKEGLPPPPAWAAALAVAIYALAKGPVFPIVAPCCVTIIAYWAAIGLRQVWSAHKVGDVSFGIYLYHFPIAQTMIALGVFAVAPVAGFVAVCALTLAMAVASWHLLEKRALRLAHRRQPATAPSLS